MTLGPRFAFMQIPHMKTRKTTSEFLPFLYDSLMKQCCFDPHPHRLRLHFSNPQEKFIVEIFPLRNLLCATLRDGAIHKKT